MVLDPTSGAIQANVKLDRPTSAPTNERPNTNVEDRSPEAGQSSESSPAVVANISAAALETARAVNGAEQSADQNSTSDVVQRDTKGQGQAASESNAPQNREEIGGRRIDIMV